MTVLSKEGNCMGGIAYFGSCPGEEFARYAFADSRIVFFCYGIYVANFMNDRRVGISAVEGWPEPIQKKLHFEAGKGFSDRWKTSASTTLAVDFSRAAHASLMNHKNTLLAAPYDLLEARPGLQLETFGIFKLIPFDRRDFWTLLMVVTRRFCDFINARLPDTKVILLDRPRTANYRGTLIDSNAYMIEFRRWQMCYPISLMLQAEVSGYAQH